MPTTRQVDSVSELLNAVIAPECQVIEIGRDLDEVPAFFLLRGAHLQGASGVRPTVRFVQGSSGVQLRGENRIQGLRLMVAPGADALAADPDVPELGSIWIEGVETVGCVRIVTHSSQQLARVEVRGLHIAAADATAQAEQPNGFGVSVLQGAFTLWVLGAGRSVPVTADLLDISVGSRQEPVRGSGVFVGGAGSTEISLNVERLRTGAVYSDGRIAPGTADRISGGVFLVHGAAAELIENRGRVTTFGANDMALDNWGEVDRWIAKASVTTYGESAIGFVNFGTVCELQVQAPIETHGQGARGFNVYSGTVERAEFDRIVTRGDGAVGVQISQPVGELRFRRGIETFGGTGTSLVKGVQQQLTAIALSIKQSGSARRITCGRLMSHGRDVMPIEQLGCVGELRVKGPFGCSERAALDV